MKIANGDYPDGRKQERFLWYSTDRGTTFKSYSDGPIMPKRTGEIPFFFYVCDKQIYWNIVYNSRWSVENNIFEKSIWKFNKTSLEYC